MRQRIAAFCLGVCLLCGMCCVPAAAETTALPQTAESSVPSVTVLTAHVTAPTLPTETTVPTETSTSTSVSTTAPTSPSQAALTLLSEAATTADSTATVQYAPDGALTVTATAAGATVAIECDKEIDLEQLRYLQLSVQAEVPFNVALKLSGETHDLYPQLTGPSWYEAFQAQAPAQDSGVTAGGYTMALDVLHYAQYNGLALAEDHRATLKTVYVTLYAPGTVTVSHLKLAASASFTAPNGESGTAATTLAPITTHSDTTKLPTKYAYYDGGDIAALDDTVRQDEESPASMIVLIVVAVLLVAAMVLLTLLKKRRDAVSSEASGEEES